MRQTRLLRNETLAAATCCWITFVAGAQGQSIPIPPERPFEFGGRPPPGRAEQSAGPPQAELACRKRLDELGAVFEPLPPIAEGACGALFPLRLSRLPGGIPIAPEATLTCDAAEALSLWVRDSVVPEAEKSLGHRPGKLLGGTSYECRGRNRDPGAQLSEHAFANGLDLSGFSFARRPALPIAGQKAGSPEDVFQAAIRASACNFFTTVLGPGVEAHADHLHLDTKRRSKGYRLCQ